MIAEMNFFWQIAAAGGALSIPMALFAWLISLWLKHAAGAYLAEKGKNLATKEDIQGITRLVEDIKHANAKELEDHRTTNQLRMAALEKRLNVAQEAYAKWSSIFPTINSKEDYYAGIESLGKWWVENNLFLSEEARQSVWWLVETWFSEWEPDKRAATVAKYQEVGKAIVRSVALPPLKGAEFDIQPSRQEPH